MEDNTGPLPEYNDSESDSFTRPRSRSLILFYLAGGLVLFFSILFGIFRAISPSYKIKIVFPPDSILVSRRVPLSVVVCGTKPPDILKLFMGGRCIAENKFPADRWHDPGRAVVSPVEVILPPAASGWYDIVASVNYCRMFSAASEPIRILVRSLDSTTVQPGDSAVGKMRGVLLRIIPQTIIDLDRARRTADTQWQLDPDYLKSRHTLEQADFDSSVKQALLNFFSSIESNDSTKAIPLVGDLINFELMRKGFPYWLSVFQTRYAQSAPSTSLLSYSIIRKLPFVFNNDTISALLLERLDNLNTLELMYGHNSPSMSTAILLEDQIISDAYDLAKCFQDKSAMYTSSVFSNMGQILNNDKRNYIWDRILLEIKSDLKLSTSNHRDSIAKAVAHIFYISIAQHEIRHLLNNRYGIGLSKYFTSKFTRIASGYRVPDRRNLTARLYVEESVYKLVRGANDEQSAYLAELAEASGLCRYVLCNLFTLAVSPDLVDTRESWAAKAVLSKFGESNGWNDLASADAAYNDPVWTALIVKLVALQPDKIAKQSADIYRSEFGDYTPARYMNY